MAAVIELTALTKRYGATVGIQGLDLRVEAGEVFGFLGPNGAGETTTIRCMVGLLSPTAGTVRVLGLDRSPTMPPSPPRSAICRGSCACTGS
jgi:ABC-2 type transport system ATP-binding protein